MTPKPRCPRCQSEKIELWVRCRGDIIVMCDNTPRHVIELENPDDFAQFFPAPEEGWTRDKRQKEVAEWCVAAFGAEHQSSVPQRGMRMLEEAIEAYQSATLGLPADEMRRKAHALIDYVFERISGNLAQECGGVGLTLLALCEAAGISAESEELREIARVKSKPLEHFWKRNQAKNEAGFDATRPSPPRSPKEPAK